MKKKLAKLSKIAFPALIAALCISSPIMAQEPETGYCSNNVLITGRIPDQEKIDDVYVLLQKNGNLEYLNNFPVSNDGNYTIKFNFNATSNIEDYTVRIKAGGEDVTNGVVTAVAESDAMKFDVDLRTDNGMAYIDESNVVNISGSIKNYYTDGTGCIMIAALYDGEGNLISSQMKDLTINYDIDNTISKWQINAAGAEKVKFFIWENTKHLIPLATAEEIKTKTYGADVLADTSNEITAVFLGDSIFQGAGASSADSNLESYLAENFKTAYSNFNAINAGIGGTYSHQGLYRLQNDAAVYNPDIVFVDFCGNDRYLGEQSYKDYMEGIVREFIKLPHQPVIVLAMPALNYPADKTHNYPANTTWAKEIADYYGALFVDFREYIQGKIDIGEIESWDVFQSTYTKDTVHPNDTGYKMFADYVWDQIKDSLNGKYELKDAINHNFVNPSLISVNSDRVTLTGAWEKVAADTDTENPAGPKAIFKDGAIKSTRGGDKITLNFKGSSIGFYIRQYSTGNTAKYYIDGQEAGTINSNSTNQGKYLVNEKHNLADGEHTLEIITQEPDGENNVFEIAYIAVDEDF